MTPLPRILRVVCGVAAAGILSATAFAADPSSGTIGSSAPKVDWKGELQGSGIYYQAWVDDPTIPCAGDPSLCDPFALTVADGPHPVTIKLHILSTNVDGSDPGAGIRIGNPDGSYQYTQGNASEQTPMVLRLKNVAAGEYEVNVVASHVCCGTDPYTASAEIAGAAPSTGTTTTTPPSTPPSPQPAPAPQVTVKAGKASAKKLNKSKKFTLTVSTTAPLNNVTGKLLKGKKAVGSAKLAKLSGTAKLVLKLKGKLKKGTYTATVSGTDDQGRTTTAGVKVKVKK